jgi:2-methylisocitrate lyase-like PEP mutase family enzyme
MKAIAVIRPTWKEILQKHAPLVLPAAHDALTARIIERSGFKAYQIGGFALAGAMHAVPDLDLEHFGEKSGVVKKILNASPLPVLVDADDGYGDAKNVTRTVQEYETMGVSALFIEDQVAPKKCGHMAGKEVIKSKEMVDKVKAAVDAKLKKEFFIIARTDAIEPHGLYDAEKRAEAYLKAGADGIYLEGPRTKRQLKQIGKNFKGVPLAVSVLEGGGKTPWLPPEEFGAMGFSMILYPTSILFRVCKAIERAVAGLAMHQRMSQDDALNLKQFEELVDMKHWAQIEEKYA